VTSVIAFCNHKGGVGKTTATANMAAALAERGATVLAVDLDPQGHLGDMFGLQPSDRPRLEQVMLGTAKAADAVVEINDHVSLLPCSEALAEAQFALVGIDDVDRRLTEALDELDGFDYVLLDSPPGIGFWSGMALVTARWALVPTLAEDLSILSSGKIADFIEDAARQANPDLELLGVLVTQAKPRRFRLMRESEGRLDQDGLRELGRVPRQEDAARAVRYGQPMFWLQPDGQVASAYRKLAETVERETGGVAV
jgi:chromosome partitioning protein